MTAEILPWAGHQLTLADWEDLPEDERFRLELVEGLLSIMPNPRPWHQRASTKLTRRVEEHLAEDLIALSEVEVVITKVPLTIRIPRTARHDRGVRCRRCADTPQAPNRAITGGSTRQGRPVCVGSAYPRVRRRMGTPARLASCVSDRHSRA